ncbi:TetR/AcrR family transcriptional regulator [Streptomyces tsukubensis]|nr:TetR/AcrR family transcriptional regulator [Streptomyces tsukubensis]
MGAATTVQRRAARPRADALRNRERIVTAAREMIVEHGTEVPLDEVARRAGVGNATLYRHFPDRDDLMGYVVLSVMDRIAALVEEALAEDADAFDGLRRFAHAAVDERIGAICPMLSAAFSEDHPDLLATRDRLDSGVRTIMERARAAGQLRDDVTVGDLLVSLTQLTRPLPGTCCVGNDRFVHRHLQLFLDGLRAPARSVLPGEAVTLEALRGC